MSFYWIEPTFSRWDSTGAWSFSSGGSPCGQFPDTTSTAIFDGSAAGQCLILSDTTVGNIIMTADYTGTLIQHESNFTFSDSSFVGGSFFAYGQNLVSPQNLYVNGTKFTSSSQTMELDGTSDIRGGVSAVAGSVTENITLTAEDATNKYVYLSAAPDVRVTMSLTALGGIPQTKQVDWDSTGMKVFWGGLGLDGAVGTGSLISVSYAPQPDGFYNYNGQAVMRGSLLRSEDTRYYNLNISTNALIIDGSSYTDNQLNLQSGSLIAGSDATIHVQGDVIFGSSFGSTDSSVNIVIDGNNYQDFVYSSGAMVPPLTVNKSSVGQVKAFGDDPIVIKGDFNISSGTFNSNNLNMRVG